MFLVAGCQEKDAGGVEVRVCGDLVVPHEIDAVRLTVFNEDRTEHWTALTELEARAQQPQIDGAAPDPISFRDGGVQGLPEDPGVNAGWLGGPCETDDDCGHARAVCYQESDGYPRGMCTLECTRSCAARAATPLLFCIADIGLPDGGCVQECDQDLLPGTGCRPGYECVTRGRFDDPSVESEVCLPLASEAPQQMMPDAGVPSEGTGDDAGCAAPELAPSDTSEMEVPAGARVSVVRNVPKGSGLLWIRAQGLRDGVVVVEREVRPTESAVLGLNRACTRVTCRPGQTCIPTICELDQECVTKRCVGNTDAMEDECFTVERCAEENCKTEPYCVEGEYVGVCGLVPVGGTCD